MCRVPREFPSEAVEARGHRLQSFPSILQSPVGHGASLPSKAQSRRAEVEHFRVFLMYKHQRRAAESVVDVQYGKKIKRMWFSSDLFHNRASEWPWAHWERGIKWKRMPRDLVHTLSCVLQHTGVQRAAVCYVLAHSLYNSFFFFKLFWCDLVHFVYLFVCFLMSTRWITELFWQIYAES